MWHLLLWMVVKRDDRLFDPSVEAVTQRVQELRNSITSFIVKLEQEHSVINWFVAPYVLLVMCRVTYDMWLFVNVSTCTVTYLGICWLTYEMNLQCSVAELKLNCTARHIVIFCSTREIVLTVRVGLWKMKNLGLNLWSVTKQTIFASGTSDLMARIMVSVSHLCPSAKWLNHF